MAKSLKIWPAIFWECSYCPFQNYEGLGDEPIKYLQCSACGAQYEVSEDGKTFTPSAPPLIPIEQSVGDEDA